MTAINEFLSSMKKEFGDNAIFTLKDRSLEEVDIIPTGSISLDLALGVGGIPRGRLTELYGNEGVGKTTLCFHIMSSAQKEGLEVLFVDMENAVDIKYAGSIGVDIDNVYWNQPTSSEEALSIIESAIRSKAFGLIVLDSIASLAPAKEQEDELGQANIALTPRALSQFFRRNNHEIRVSNSAILFTNQIRDKIGSYYGGIATPGGHAKNHARSVALYMTRSGDIKEGNDITGFTASISVKKNKVAPPFKTAQFDIIYGKGIDPHRDLIEVAKSLGIVLVKGSYYVYNDKNLGQGKENSAQTLRENPELMQEIREACFVN